VAVRSIKGEAPNGEKFHPSYHLSVVVFCRNAKTSESRAGREQSPKVAGASATMQSQDILEVKVNVSDLKDGQ